jgi:hypothetical protein
MIEQPVFIVGAPRSGTSTVFHILRTSPPFWSLPSEAQHLWDRLCHPSLRQWRSEEFLEGDPIAEEEVIRLYESFQRDSMPWWFWRRVANTEMIWQKNPAPYRKSLGSLYSVATHFLYFLNPLASRLRRRILDKTASNSLRMELVNRLFPDAKFIHVCRDGALSVDSIMEGWLQKNRFTTFQLPEPITLDRFQGNNWSFVLPEGWRDKANEGHLADLCAWQWSVCQERILAFKQRHPEKCITLRLEDLQLSPQVELDRLGGFLQIDPSMFYLGSGGGVPVVNAKRDRKRQGLVFPEHKERIQRIIGPWQEILGYGSQENNQVNQ